MLATVSGQAYHFGSLIANHRAWLRVAAACLQAAELGEDRLASDLRARLRSQPDRGPIPIWTTRRTSRALSAKLGRHARLNKCGGGVGGRLGGQRREDGRVLVWDPAAPGAGGELGRHDDSVLAVAGLADGRVVSGGEGKRVLVWDPAHRKPTRSSSVGPRRPGGGGGGAAGRTGGRGGERQAGVGVGPGGAETGPVELGGHDGPVPAVAVLPDGRVVGGGYNKRVRVWDPERPETVRSS